eukprot:208022-Chlamydomonas_euryale.AAC.1
MQSVNQACMPMQMSSHRTPTVVVDCQDFSLAAAAAAAVRKHRATQQQPKAQSATHALALAALEPECTDGRRGGMSR